MPNKTFNARVQMKRDTSTNWTSNNPVLLYGEIIIVDTDAGEIRFKVGNGTSTYTQLPFTDEAIINKMLSVNGGTMAGNINMSGHSVTGLSAPVNPTDAVRQQDLEVLSEEIDGIIAGTSPITLPIASDVRLGGVKVGEGVEITEDGTLNVNGFVPETRTVNGKALNQDISLSASDVGAVPTSRTVNGKALSSNITLTADDVGAGPESTAQTITLSSSSWSASGSIYQQVATVTGVTADTPVIIVEPSLSTTDADANATILEAWGKISQLEMSQGAGTITFRATENPGINVPVKVGVC